MKRREVLHKLAYASALLGVPLQGEPSKGSPLPEDSLYQSDREAYWRRIRNEQFSLPEWRTFLNNGSLGVIPHPVMRAMVEYMERAAALNLEEYPRWGYETLDEMRSEMAGFVGCTRDELAFVHNATEAMSTIAGGLDLKAGDEVLTTDQEHPSGSCCWQEKAERYGITIRKVAIPIPPKGPEQLVDLLVSSIGPRTRVLSFSGITTTTGLIFPVREICEAARAKNVITVVDGAHMNGQVPVTLRDLGCDYFAGSPHKWLFAPAGCGLLYGRGDMLDRLWPNTVTAGWDKKQENKAARFMMVGTNNRAIFEGMMAGLRFARQIGPHRIYSRQKHLSQKVLDRARRTRQVELATPGDERMYAALVTVRFKTDKLDPLWALCKKKRIWVITAQQLRLSSHIHTRPEDVDLFFDTVEEALG